MRAHRGSKRHERANLLLPENWSSFLGLLDDGQTITPKAIFSSSKYHLPQEGFLDTHVQQFFRPLRPLLIINHMVLASRFALVGLVCLSSSASCSSPEVGDCALCLHPMATSPSTCTHYRLGRHVSYRWMKESNRHPSVKSCCSRLKH